MNAKLIAPCGINCGVCRAYLREKNACSGCRARNKGKPITRTACKIKKCKILKDGKKKFCFECVEFPCKVQKNLDKRYKTRYNISTIENLEKIKKVGISKFIKDEKIKWTCIKCGNTICAHTGLCINCEKNNY